MNLLELKRQIQEAEKDPTNFDKFIGDPHATLIYGESKSGKTQLAATLAELDWFEEVVFLAPEKGVSDTLLAMNAEGRLSDGALSKINVINIVDTRQQPNGFKTIMTFLTKPKEVHKICALHGVISCGECIRAKLPFHELSYSKLTRRSLLVIDSLSQTGESAINTILSKQDVTYKPQLDDYGGQGKMIRDLLGIIQAVEYCYIVAITHVDMFEDEAGKKRYYPLCGTSKMSPNVAKYFGTVITTRVDATKKRHTAASSTTYSALFQTGSRTSVSIENAPEADLKYIYSGRLIPGEKYDLDAKKPAGTALAAKPAAQSTTLQQRLDSLQKKDA